MYKKLTCLITVFLVGFVLPGMAAAADPNLVGWWKFDEGSGTVAQDSSGYGNHGTIGGANWNWATGFIGGALNINAAGYVDVPAKAWSTVQRQVTVAFWAYGDPPRQPQNHFAFGAFLDSADGNSRIASCHIPWSNGNVYFDTSGVTGVFSPDRIYKAATPAEYEGRWQHWAFTKNVTTGEQRIYLNGVLWHSGSGMIKTMAGANVTAFTIGDWPGHDSPYAGMIDDFRLYNRALTEAELKVLAARPKAYDPVPGNGAAGVTTPLLQWTAGTFAAFHDVYFGTNPTPGPAEFKGRQTWNMYWHGPGLTPGTTCYWRVDEIEADGVTIHTGDVWSFTAAPVTAYDPSPCNDMKWVDSDADLSWKAGMNAVKHDVYFGTNQADVANGTGGTFKVNQGLTTYDPGAVAANTTYYWRIDEIEQGGAKHPGQVWSFTTMGPVPSGAGLKGEYYQWSGGAPPAREDAFSTLRLTRIDPVVDFPWGDASPAPGINADQFAVRWTGEIEIPTTAAYTFSTSTDDGIRLWVNNQLIIENWTEHGTTTDTSKPIELTAGRYPIQMEWYENGGGAVARLFWASPCIPSQIIPAVALSPPVRASAPRPPDGATDVMQTPVLRWDAGYKALKHNVYFGGDTATVENATTASAGIYRGQQNLAANSYVPSEAPLAWSSTYFWRIDEVNAADTWKGSVWSFTTADFLVVDDFEDYTDDVGSRIFQTWKDGWGYTQPPPGYSGNGTGSAVGNSVPPYAEPTVVHGGGQSMPLGYDNTGTTGKARYSETFREWTTPQDWTVNSVRALTLYVQGIPPDFLESPPNTFTMSAEGSDIWGGSDEFRYVYKQLSGDGEIIARVDRIAGPGTNTWAKAGVMIRETLDPTSKHAFMAVTPTPSYGLAFQYRDGIDAADSDSEHGVDVQTAPYWVKLVRKGNQFTGYVSPDGIDWRMKDASGTETDASNPVTITMATNVYIGLALTSHENDVLRMAQFSNVSIPTGSVTGAWTVADIASTVTGTNAIEPLYVAVEDSAAKVKVITNDNPLASVDPSWQEWNIDLAQVSAAGVNLKAIKKIYIGLGNRTSPMAGGTGKIFVDDIQVHPSRCVPSLAKPVADLSGNCVVDYADIEIMAGDWLATGAGLSADLRQDNAINFKDFAVLADSWLEEILWP